MRSMILMTCLLTAATPVAVAAGPPALINYQGVLRDAANRPLTGDYDMVFYFFDALTGGNEILVDSHTGGSAVPVSGGVFKTRLGSGSVSDGLGPGTYTSLKDVFRDYSAVYLEIRVATETLTPRVQVLSAGFALNAATLGGNDPSAFATSVHGHDGSDITSGLVSNSRLRTGHGNGLDADTVDTLHAADLVPASTNVSYSNKVVRQGANLVWNSNSQIQIKPGVLGFPDGKLRETTSELMWDFANGDGPLGLDAGSGAASTWYFMYAVPDIVDDSRFTAVASTQSPPQAGGAGPTGYAVYRFVGSFRTDSSSRIRKFYRQGTGVHWDDYTAWISVCTGYLPAVNTWVPVDASGDEPVTSRSIDLNGYYRVDCGSNFVEWYLTPGAGPAYGSGVYFCLNGAGNPTVTCELPLPTVGQKFSYYAAQGGGPHQACHCALFRYLGYEEDLNEF